MEKLKREREREREGHRDSVRMRRLGRRVDTGMLRPACGGRCRKAEVWSGMCSGERRGGLNSEEWRL